MGRLWARTRKNKESVTFEYDKTWLDNPACSSLEPALQVGPARFTRQPTRPYLAQSATQRKIGGAERSCAAWNEDVLNARTPRRARFRKIDFLLLVDDEARQGALRFAEKESGPFVQRGSVKLRLSGRCERSWRGTRAGNITCDTDRTLKLLGCTSVRELNRSYVNVPSERSNA